MCQLNFMPTRHIIKCNPSLLDHIFVNNPNNVSSIETTPSLIADHCLVKIIYHCKLLKTPVKFRRIRNFNLITSESLMQKIIECESLQTAFQETDPEEKIKTIIRELNRIIEEIAPSRVVKLTI